MALRLALALVGSRLRAAGPRHWALVAALAVAVAVPVLVSTFAAVTADAALLRALADLPADQRAVTVAGRLPARSGAADLTRVDSAVRAELGPLVAGTARREVEYRPLNDGSGRIFTLAGLDGLGGAVRRTGGRLPASCRPERCEVLAIGSGPAAAVPDPASVGIVVVGRGVLTDPLLLSGNLAPQTGSTVLLADGVPAVAAVAELSLIDRTFGWVGPLDRDLIRRQGADAWTARTAAAAGRLDPLGATIISPDEAVTLAADRAAASTARFGLLAGGFAVLLLGTAVVGAAGLRGDHTRFVAALRRRGLGVSALRLVTGGECLAIAGAGLVGGLLAGAVPALAITASAGMPLPGSVLGILADALPECLALGLAAGALLLLILWPAVDRPAWTDERAAWRLLGYAAAAAAVALLLVISRGSSTGAADSLLTTLPVLALLVAALWAARAWPGLVRLAARSVPRRRVGLRLGVAASARYQLLAAATVALLAAGIGGCQFAVSYRTTLRQGALDQAAFRVPTDLRLQAGNRPGNSAVPPLGLASADTYAAAAGAGSRAYGVLRSAGSVRVDSTRSDVVQLVGLPPGALSAVHRWPRVAGGTDPASTALRIADPRAAEGVRLPAGRTLTARVQKQPKDEVTAWLRADDGRERSVLLHPAGDRALHGTLPEPGSGSGWRLFGLSVAQDFGDASRRGHSGESPNARAVPSGSVRLTGLAVDGADLARPFAGWTAPSAAGLRVTDAGAGVSLDYRLETGAVVLTAPAGTSSTAVGSAGAPLAVAADPRTAAAGPLVTLTVDQRPVVVRVVATLDRFPTLTGRFVVADRAPLASVLDRAEPGAGQPQQVWLQRAASAAVLNPARLAAAPFDGIDVSSATVVQRSLLSDPVAVGASRLLLVAAGLTLLISLVALVLLVVGERFEGAAEMFSLEADGVPAGTLRAALWSGAALAAVLAVPFGVVAGLALTGVTARLVPLTAGAQVPQPPLVAAGGVVTGLGVALGGLASALLVAAVVSHRFFREPMPVLPNPS